MIPEVKKEYTLFYKAQHNYTFAPKTRGDEMAATTQIVGRVVRSLEDCQRELAKISDPKAKFQRFDELTNRELFATAYKVLHAGAKDPNFVFPEATDNLQWPTNKIYVPSLISAINLCLHLSQSTVQSLGPDGENKLSHICRRVGTYMDNKVLHALGRILMSKNCVGSASETHSLHLLNTIMWKLQKDNHGDQCPCYSRIQATIDKAVNPEVPPQQRDVSHAPLPPSSTAAPWRAEQYDSNLSYVKTYLSNHAPDSKKLPTVISVKYDAGLGNKLFIRGEGADLSWEHGIELKNTGSDSWVYETRAVFGLQYKILLNDTQYESGDNHKIEPGKKEEIRPKF